MTFYSFVRAACPRMNFRLALYLEKDKLGRRKTLMTLMF